jgi:hypothetical protein
MSDEPITDGQVLATPVSESPYAFLHELMNLDAEDGILSQTELGNLLGFSEGVVRGAIKAVSKSIPLEQLKEDGRGKLTERGVKLATMFIQRGDSTTAEAWMHGLMEAMKSPEHKALTGEIEAASAADIDLGFLGDRAAKIEADSNALALRGDTALAELMAKNAELDQRMNDLSSKEVQAAEDAAYQAELDKLTAALRGKMRAKRAFLESLEKQGLTPEI